MHGLVSRRNGAVDSSMYVVLTGTTGSLGSSLLDELLDCPNVKRVYCLIRSLGEDTTARQLTNFKERGLDVEKLKSAIGSRVYIHDVDFGRPDLGLSPADYEEVYLTPLPTLHD